jgi:two-component system CitB family sensor kinase
MRRLTFARQMLLLQTAVVIVVVALATTTYGVLATLENRRNAELTALAIARTVASAPEIRGEVQRISALDDPGSASDLAGGVIQRTATAMRERTRALFIVVTDEKGARLAHPTPSMLGQMVSTDPSAALRGRETTSWETGTLGESARAKVPVFGMEGDRVVGEVSVGFGAAQVLGSAGDELVGIAVVAALALAIGVAASSLLARRLRRQTLGLQPADLAGLVLDQTAVIGGIGEGVLGVAPDGRVTVCNARAADLLGLEQPVGKTVSTLALPAELADAFRTVTAEGARSLRFVSAGRILYADVSRVTREGTDLGTVTAVRDQTDVETLSRRLTAVSALSTALRVQRHEFANRLHLVSGLLATSQVAVARDYLNDLLAQGAVSYPLPGADQLAEPYLQAFLGAKAVEARERGVSLRIGEGTLVRGALVRADEATTVLGNLVDNAVSAAVDGDSDDRWVEVEVLDDGADLHMAVADSGNGIADGVDVWAPRTPVPDELAAGAVDQVHGLGLGLPLCREIARRDGGDVWVADPGGATTGAVFCARLVGVMRFEPFPSPAEQKDAAT